jgi:hypothetical protein
MPTTATTPTPPPSMTLISQRSVKDATTPMLPYVVSPPIRLVSMLIPAWSVATPVAHTLGANGRYIGVDGALTIKRNSKIGVGENGNVEQR